MKIRLYCRGQSAIEYLMTYGWMLLVVAIAGGAIFSVTQQQNVQSVSGFTGGDILVEDFGVTSTGDIQFEFRNGASEGLNISEVNISDPTTDKYISKRFKTGSIVRVGDSKLFSLPNLTRSNANTRLNVEIRYDAGGLSNLTTQGTVSGGFNIQNTVVSAGSPTDEDDPSQVQVIDSFEDGDLAEYTDTFQASTNQSPLSFDGNYMFETGGSAYTQGRVSSENSSGGALPEYPKPGDSISFRVYMENVSRDQIWMDTGDSSSERYGVMLDILNDELVIENSSTSTSTTLTEIPSANSWITIELDWEESGNIEGRWKDENGDIIDEVSTPATAYTTGGEFLSIVAYLGDSGGSSYIDYIAIEPLN